MMNSDSTQKPSFISNASSPRQRRVTPFGEMIAVGDGGNVMGNRGGLQHTKGRSAGVQRPEAWIICRIESGNRHRPKVDPDQYTELFFWDEATALAAGHRPCYECSRARYLAFVDAWRRGNPALSGEKKWNLAQLDNALAVERLTDGISVRHYVEKIDALPTGTFISWLEDKKRYPVLINDERLLLWTPGGYCSSRLKPKGIEVEVLTPRLTVNALKAGYVPSIELPEMPLPVEYFDLFDYAPRQGRYTRTEKYINEQFLRPIK